MRNRKLIFTAIFAFVAVGFNSCIEDPEPVALDVVPDVFIQKSVENGEEKYGLNFWVYGNKPLESALADGPDDETWTLEQDENSQYVFRLFPETAQYTDSMPPTGNYAFTVTSTQEGESPVNVVDKLEDKELEAASIDSVQYVSSELKTTWAAIEDADAYVIRLYDESDNQIYISPAIAPNKTDYSFGTNDTVGWININKKAETGKTYRVELLAVLYESTSTSANKEYNIQFLSATSVEFVWGE